MNENLTPQIVTALLQDGTVKMTGEEIAAAIADAIGALDKPYRFRGVATPDLAPGSIFEPTLYVAVANATYGPFSNQSVDKGQIVFFTSDDEGYWDAVTAYDPNPGGGGESGLKVIVSTADWVLISRDGVTANTKAEAAQIAGITEDELDFLLNGGDLTPCLFVFGANGGDPNNYSYHTSPVGRGHFETGGVSFTAGNDEAPSALLENGVYTIYGFGE